VAAMLIPSIQRLSTSGMNLVPMSQADDQVNVSIRLPIGTNNDLTRQYIFDFQDIVKREIPAEAIKNIVLNTGNSNSGSIQINLPALEEQTMNARQIQDKLNPFLNLWSDVTISFSAGRGPGGGGQGINIRVISDDDDASSAVCNDIVALLKAREGQVVNPTTDLENGAPRYEITIDTDAASAAGVNVNTISSILRTAITGTTATNFHVGEDDISIIVALSEDELMEPADLGAITIQTANGLMSLDNFISYRKALSPQQIQREEGVRVNRVTASLAPGAVATVVQARVEQLIRDNIVLPDTV
jgi:HAE1 family hydrophobic/amphiphilic exporter-1